jgi:hypothetical protein
MHIAHALTIRRAFQGSRKPRLPIFAVSNAVAASEKLFGSPP